MTSIISNETKNFGNAKFEPGELFSLTAANVSSFVRGLPTRAQIMFRVLVNLQYGTLTIQMPDGRWAIIKGKQTGPEATIILHNWNLLQKALTNATIGVAESYLAHDWDSPDVASLLELFAMNQKVGRIISERARGLMRLFERIRHWLNSNTKTQAKKNISAHYDLGNEFYQHWLDETMTYSSALFEDGATDLKSAQRAKYKALADQAGVQKGDRILEIGCGWGGFAEYAAKELDCHVTGLSLSQEQLKFAQQRLAGQNLAHKVDFRYQDYRDETETYDRIISIEMFEAVGERYWGTYFDKINQCLKPGGKAGIQVITINPQTYDHFRKNPDFIQRYIFPGGMLPSDDGLEALGAASGLTLTSNKAFGLDYARTLAQWREHFWEKWDQIKELGFDARFKRLWEFYLFYCEAGFRAGSINVRQVVYSHKT